MMKNCMLALMILLAPASLKAADIWQAADDGDLKTLKSLARLGVDIKARDSHGYTPLFHAAWRGQLKVVRYLAGRKAGLEIADRYGMTPLMIAAREGHAPVVKYLLSRRARADAVDSSGRTAMIHAADNRRHSVLGTPRAREEQERLRRGDCLTVKYLLAGGGRADHRDRTGATALHYAAEVSRDDIAALLIPPLKKSPEGGEILADALVISCFTGNTRLMKRLTAEGIPLSVKASKRIRRLAGMTPLMAAARGDQIELARELLQKGADVNEWGTGRSGGKTALMAAAEENHYEMTILLLESDANAGLRDAHGKTAEDYTGKKILKRVLRDAVSGRFRRPEGFEYGMTRALFQHIRKGDSERAMKIIEQGIDPDAREDNRYSLLHAAARQGMTDVAKLLIWKGAELDARDGQRSTPLMAAAYAGHAETAELLLRNGAQADAVGPGGNTPLTYAVMQNNSVMVALLRKHGARKINWNNVPESYKEIYREK